MKYKLTPQLAYFIGFWKKLKQSEGISIRADKCKVEHFIKLILELKLIEPNKIQLSDDMKKACFYHTKLRTFMQNIVKNELNKFKYKNDYAASYIAGIFDAAGKIYTTKIDKEKKQKNEENNQNTLCAISIQNSNKYEELLISRLGFRVKLVNKVLYVSRGEELLNFIKEKLRLEKKWGN